MARFKTTDENLSMFKALCEKWLSNFGIKSYITSFRRAPTRAMAMVNVRVNSRSARFRLANTWPEEVVPSLLERCAIHECLHVLTAQLVAEALPVDKANLATIPADRDHVDREEEALVVTLENVITKLMDEAAVTPVSKKYDTGICPTNGVGAGSTLARYSLGMHDVILQTCGQLKVNVVKAVREIRGCSFQEAVDVVNAGPGTVVKFNLHGADLDHALTLLRSAGALVVARPHAS